MKFDKVTNFDIFAREAIPLFKEHRKEVDLFGLQLTPDWKTYRLLFNRFEYMIYEVRDGLELVGYCGFYLYNHSHHSTCLQAKQDILFLSKPYRGFTGLKFLRYCDDELRNIGVKIVLHCVPATNDWGEVLLRMNYSKLETIYKKEL